MPAQNSSNRNFARNGVIMKSLVTVVLSLTASISYALEDVNPDLAEITNFRQYSDTFASAGQPTREQFQAIADNGFERVV